MEFLTELLSDRQTWWRIAERSWSNPLDPAWSRRAGGRWNPPNRIATLYFNEDRVTARLNLRAFIARWPYEPEDLRADTGPVLVGATLPREQQVADIHTPEGVQAAGLPKTYPRDHKGVVIGHERCQSIGLKVKLAGLRGIRSRSAQARHGEGRDLAWFPATARSVAKQTEYLLFDEWYWS